MVKNQSVFLEEPFFQQNPTAKSLVSLFECLGNVIFYAKDSRGRFIAANTAMLETKNITGPSGIIGKTDHDFHPPMLADAYVAEDRRVMESGKALSNQIWFVLDRFGRPGWFNSSKVPLRDFDGEVIGVAGVRSSIGTAEHLSGGFKLLKPVLSYLEEHYTESISMKEMAALAQLSSTHFNRQFSALLGISPTQFLHSLRIEKARQLLGSTSLSVGEVALETGYHDQSHFSRNFRRLTGVSPREYRLRFRRKELG